MRRIDARGLANCSLVNNGDDLLRRAVSPSVAEGWCRRGDRRVECPLNKQIPKLAHYLRQYHVAGSAADAWRTEGQSVIYPAAVRTWDVGAMRCESATRKREAGWDPVTSLPTHGKVRWITENSRARANSLVPVLLKRGFSVEKGDASSSWLSTWRKLPLNFCKFIRKNERLVFHV